MITGQSLLDNSSDFIVDTNALPITIQPGHIVNLNFCFTPHEIGMDTLHIQWLTNVSEPFTHELKDTTLLLGNGILSRLSVSEAGANVGNLRLILSGDQLVISLPSEFKNDTHLSIYDVMGRQIRAFESQSQMESLDIGNLPNGTYYLRASKGNIVKTVAFTITR
jgi:hypothetical protein